jgi:large subunit ribosomal protein L13
MYLSPIIMTPFIKKKEISKDWYIIDAQNAAVGRLAAYISKVLRGKNKATYNPHIDNGDFVVVTNIDKIKFSGKKFSNKKYYRHTGHPGGIKETTPLSLKEKNKTEEILKLAVKRMLPGGPLAKKQLTKLKIYNGDKHPHEMQKPKIIEFEKLNKRNVIK